MTIQTVNSTILKSWIDNNQAILIDVREPAEFNNQHIDGAKLLPLSKITTEHLKNFTKDNEGKKLVIYCAKGGRGNSACEKLKDSAYNIELYNLEGGITNWIANGGVVTKKAGFFLPLDRQVQLTIGLCVLLASLASVFININFAYLAAFFGAGLTFAGITGFCGLALLMAKMPWNKDKRNCKTFCATR